MIFRVKCANPASAIAKDVIRLFRVSKMYNYPGKATPIFLAIADVNRH